MRAAFLFLFTLVTAAVYSQGYSNFSGNYDSCRYSASAIGEYSVNSNALNNALFKKIYTGQYISAADKDAVLKKLKNSNRMGLDIRSGVSFSQKLDTVFKQTGYSYFVSLRNCTHFDMSFSRDFYKVLAYGNLPYAGTTASLGGLSASYVVYQQAQVGLSKKIISDSTLVEYGLGLSFLNGQRNLLIRVPTADLFTEQYGNNLSLDLHGQMAQSDTTKGAFGTSSGTGFCADFFYNTRLKNGSIISISIANLGFIQFNDRSPVYYTDSTYTFDGLKVESLVKLKDSVLLAIGKDTVMNNITTHGSKGYSYTLPSTFTFNFHYPLKPHKLELDGGIIAHLQANYQPLFYASATWFVCSKFVFVPMLSYGGYGNLNIGLGFETDMGKGFVLRGGSYNVEGYILPEKTTGQGVFIGLKKYF